MTCPRFTAHTLNLISLSVRLAPPIFCFIKKLLTNTLRGYIIKIPREGIFKFRSKFRGNTMSENKTSVKKVCPCCQKHTVRDEKHRKALLNRLKRIEGQVRGIEAMIENDAYCNDVLIQSAAVNAAMNAFNKELLASHIRGCVARDIREGKDEVIDELVATLQKLMK